MKYCFSCDSEIKFVKEIETFTWYNFIFRVLESLLHCFFQITWADVQFYNMMEFPKTMGVNMNVEKFPKLHAVFKKVESHPQIQEWISKRPQ